MERLERLLEDGGERWRGCRDCWRLVEVGSRGNIRVVDDTSEWEIIIETVRG